jgi:hypothetical protein
MELVKRRRNRDSKEKKTDCRKAEPHSIPHKLDTKRDWLRATN